MLAQKLHLGFNQHLGHRRNCVAWLSGVWILNLPSVAFCSPAKSLTSGSMENPLVGKMF